MSQMRQGMSWPRVGLWGVAGLVAASVLAFCGMAYAAGVSKPGFTGSVTDTVMPKHLPSKGSASVKLTIAGSITRSDYQAPRLDYFDVKLDPQLKIDVKGLPVCVAEGTFFYEDVEPAVAMQKCGGALVGRGSISETTQIPEAFPPSYTTTYTALFFNAKEKGVPTILLYTFANTRPSQYSRSHATPAGTGRSLHFDAFEGTAEANDTSFQFTLGKTWKYQGTKHSYLSGSCRTGTLKNQLALTVDKQTTSSATPQRCAKQGG